MLRWSVCLGSGSSDALARLASACTFVVYSAAAMICTYSVVHDLHLVRRCETCWVATHLYVCAVGQDMRACGGGSCLAIQMQTMPSIRKGHDVNALVTCDFAASLLSRLLRNQSFGAAGAVVPVHSSTRELAEQVAREVRSFVDETQLVCRLPRKAVIRPVGLLSTH